MVMCRVVVLQILFLPSHPTTYPSRWREKCQQTYEYPSGDSASRVIRSAPPRILIDENAALHQLQSVRDSDCSYYEK